MTGYKKPSLPAVLMYAFILLFACCSSCSHFKKIQYESTSFKGGQIHYLKNGTGPMTLVFIHGWSCDHTFWKYQTAFFKNTYRVIAIDLPGHGKSDKPVVPYTFDFFAEAIKAVLDAAGVKKAFLVGHSMGYPVARRFIKNYPNRSVGLCIVDGAYFRVPHDPETFHVWEKQNNAFVEAFKSGDRDLFIDQFLESLFVEATPLSLKQEIKQKIRHTPDYVANSAMEEMVKADNWKEYRLAVPTLAVYAVSEDLPEDNEAYLKTMFPRMEYHAWDQVGHFIMMEQPDRFNRLLARYLKAFLRDRP